MEQTRLNAYRIMWLFVFFDLPVTTKKEKKRASIFRRDLLKDGFTMLQFSVYIRHCASKESAEVHVARIEKLIPDKGHVNIATITDKQYGNIINFWGKKDSGMEKGPAQLEIF
jgi:CRISPR-associated protein Cas2